MDRCMAEQSHVVMERRRWKKEVRAMVYCPPLSVGPSNQGGIAARTALSLSLSPLDFLIGLH